MIGKTIWVFNRNYRIYRDDDGNKTDGPVYKHHWRPHEVVSETTHSWILDNGDKVPKNTQFPTLGWCISQEQIDEDVWDNDHRHKVVDALWNVDISTLQKVAKLIGYNK